MIGYITLGTNDLPRATAFYDKLFASIGGRRAYEAEGFVVWGFGPTGSGFGVCKTFDKKPATVGNGSMVGLSMTSNEGVDTLYRLALSLGATDEGAPGSRGVYYAAFFRDLDGHKIQPYYMP